VQTDLAQADKLILNLASLLEQAQSARHIMRSSDEKPHVNWVTIEKFCGYSGYSKIAVNKKIHNGMWLEGLIWKKAKDGRILINLQGYDQWVQSA